MGKIHGTVVDAVSGERLAAKVHVMSPNGRFLKPAGSLEKRGPGTPFFYCDGVFEVEANRGQVDVRVERGTEYTPYHAVVEVSGQDVVDLQIEMARWVDLPEAGWYPGNTHIHYDEKESRPHDRLAYDADVETYNVTAVSILQRWDLNYASNRFPLGLMTDYCSGHHVVDVGEENRHNDTSNRIGYGHVMFLRIQNVVDPVSRGFLVDDFHPDYPPLCFACDEAREQGGLVIWCHNGLGMEAPVAAALGKLDAFNLFDPYWMDPEYDLWYRLLNCGLRLPASTGTDWFVCSNNRVYVQMEEAFSYDAWIDGMRRGRTFITNGPALFLRADGVGPGDSIQVGGGRTVGLRVDWSSHHPVDRVDLIHNGVVIQTKSLSDGSREGSWEVDLMASGDGWVAARCNGAARDSYDQAVYAHTSPAYLAGVSENPCRQDAAALFAQSIDNSMAWVRRSGRFSRDDQRDAVLALFEEGREVYQGMMG